MEDFSHLSALDGNPSVRRRDDARSSDGGSVRLGTRDGSSLISIGDGAFLGGADRDESADGVLLDEPSVLSFSGSDEVVRENRLSLRELLRLSMSSLDVSR